MTKRALKDKLKFTLVCPKCGARFEADLSSIYGSSDECDTCGSHSSITINCPKCHYSYHGSEI